MIDNKYSIPVVYKKMDERGFFNPETYLWIDDMEWIPIEKIREYEYEEGESRCIIPFAHTTGYDKWVWVVNEENKDYSVGLCETSEINGVYYANNTEDAILRHIIEYLSSADFYINREDALSYQISEEKLKSYLYSWKNRLTGILCDEYIDLIEAFSKLNLKQCRHTYGEWCALLSYEERDELIDKYVKFDLINEEFLWFKY